MNKNATEIYMACQENREIRHKYRTEKMCK